MEHIKQNQDQHRQAEFCVGAAAPGVSFRSVSNGCTMDGEERQPLFESMRNGTAKWIQHPNPE